MDDTSGQKTPDNHVVLQDMKKWSGPASRNFGNPFYILFIITVSIFLAETIVAILFENGAHFLQAFLHALFLIVIIFPALYVFMLKPMRAYIGGYDKAMDVLKESEEKFRDLAEKSPNMIFINRKGNVVYANQVCEEITGYTIDELCSPDFNFMTLIAPESMYIVNENLKKHMNGEEVPVYDYSLITREGARVEVMIATKLVHYGGETAILGIVTDITDRKRAEDAYLQRDEELRAIVESSTDGVLVVDSQGKVIHTNRKFAEMWRIPDEIIRTSSDEKLLNHVLDQLEDPHAFISKVISLYKSAESGFDMLVFKDGRVFERYSNPLMLHGVVSGRVWAFRDMSERKRVEQAVLDIARGISATTGEKFFLSLVEHLADILSADYAYIAEIITDRPNMVKTVSLIADGKFIDNIEVDLRGTPCETVLDKITCCYPEGIRSKFPEAHMMASMGVEGYAGTLLTGSSGGPLGLMAVMYRRPVGNIKMVESMLQIFAARASAEIERRRSEEALRKAKEEIESWNRELEKRVEEKSDELKKSHARLIQSEKLSVMGQLAAGLAHELNSPLAGLLPLLDKYRRNAEKGSGEYDELTLMHKAGEHMAKIVRDFGSFSRDDKGAFVELSLNEMIEDTLNFSASQLKKRGIIINREYAAGLPPINADRTGLQQVVLNMIANARDAMPGGGEFLIRTGFTDGGNRVKMEFTDNGHGIGEDVLDKIFDPFFTTKKHGDGVGLGLSLSYGIIRKHNGEIFVESAEGKGSRFTVVLPLI